MGGADFCPEWGGTADEVLALLKRNNVAPEAGPGPRRCARGPSISVYFRDPDDNLAGTRNPTKQRLRTFLGCLDDGTRPAAAGSHKEDRPQG
jgi:hypothetical protein